METEYQCLDIINLIEHNPITRLSNDYQNRFIQKIKENFTESQQRLFVSSFYTYLNYNSKTDFIIDMIDVWKWLGFSRKEECKRTLTKNFIEDKEYKIIKNFVPQVGVAKNTTEDNRESFAPEVAGVKKETRGGYNKEKILMTVNTFKKLCLKSNTKKADEIHDYFIKLEEILQDILIEESTELQQQLQQKEQLLIQQREQTVEEKDELLEKTLLNQFPINTQCIYYGRIDNKDSVGGTLIKFGMSNNLRDRVKQHKKIYSNFKLTNAFKVSNQIEIENCIKKHQILKNRIRNIMINDMNYRELICIDETKNDTDFSLERLNDYIKNIIEENQYNLENYKKLLDTNEELQNEIYKLNDENKNLKEETTNLKKMVEKYRPSLDETKLKSHNKVETNGGYSVFAFQFDEHKFKIVLCKTATLEMREKVYKESYPNGEIKYRTQLKHPFLEKVLLYLMKRHLIFLSIDTFDGLLEDIQMIFNIVNKLEELLINNDLHNVMKLINNEKIDIVYNDPEVPFVKKAKRTVDQVDINTGKIIATYPSIEAAGRALGLTTGTAIGVALRNKNICQGFLWRYSGISKEDQMNDQPVIRINCDTAEKTYYPNIASAARAVKISPPGLRNRILTDVHANGFHWIFHKTATHYK